MNPSYTILKMDKTMSRLLLLLVISVGMTVTQAASSKPHVDFLEPDNFTDSLGNEVDKMSNIKFFTSKAKDNYKAGKSVDSSAIAMSAWFSDMSASLARSAMSGGFPFGEVHLFKLISQETYQLKLWCCKYVKRKY